MINPYVQAFNAFPFPSLILEPKGAGFSVLDANEIYCQLWGIHKREIVGKKYPFIPEKCKEIEQHRQERVESLIRVFETGKPDKIELPQLDIPHGWAEHNNSSGSVENIPLKDNKGDVVQILSMIIDLKGNYFQKEAELSGEIFHPQEYENFIEKNKDGLYSLDTEGNFLNLNEGLSNLAESSQEELLKTNFIPFCAPHDRERTIQYFQKALQGENQVFEADFISAKGNRLVLEITLNPMKIKGEISGVYGIAKDKTPVKEREELFYRNEKRLKALVHEGLDIVGILEPGGTYKFVSDTVKKVLGAEPCYYVGKNAFDFIHPEDKEGVMADFSLLEDKKQVKIGLFRFKNADGDWRWMETLVTNLLDDPYVEGLVTNSRDVTELVEQSQKIKQLYERYTLAAEATEDVIYDWDLISNEVIRFHKSSEKLFGYNRREIDDPDFWISNIHPEDLQKVQENLKRILSDSEQHHIRTQYRFRRADGSYAQVIDRSSIVRDGTGKAIRMIGATIDISEIMSNKEALKMANKRFSYAMKATKEIIWDWDILNGHIKRSGSFSKIFGYKTTKSPSGEDFWFGKIVDKDREKIKKSIYSAIEDPGVKKWREEYCFLRKDGEEAFVVDRGYILRDRQGKAIRMVGAVLDVTESRRMIKEIQKQNEVLKEIAWEQAHVVRAPLARLKGLLDLLEEESFEEWSREELVVLIKNSAEEVDEVIENIVRKTEKIGS